METPILRTGYLMIGSVNDIIHRLSKNRELPQLLPCDLFYTERQESLEKVRHQVPSKFVPYSSSALVSGIMQSWLKPDGVLKQKQPPLPFFSVFRKLTTAPGNIRQSKL
ncbi:unnamed protein product [Euphydryas editha]|uniref:Uncharacterized protein n=1 Tax=Euphydryas editha TaxID=104508 RepID=A0AAU9UB99_EUPED|nr:unnamed protein product [Euphydryas editha]